MSFEKLDQTFPTKLGRISDEIMVKIIAESLREDFEDIPSAIKVIGQKTDIKPRSIKNWYEAKNLPSAGHLIILARVSPTLMKFILEQLGGRSLFELYRLCHEFESEQNAAENNTIYSVKNDPINVPIKLNKRQKWFLLQLQTGHKKSADDLVLKFNTSLKTAKRDITDLKVKGKIRFCGSKKTGYYVLVGQS
jgi:hypothetical protein